MIIILRRKIWAGVLFFILLAALANNVLAAAPANISLQASGAQAVKGERLTVNVSLQNLGGRLMGIQTVIRYDPLLARLESVDEPAGGSVLAPVLLSFVEVDAGEGLVEFSAVRGREPSPRNGGDLCALNFRLLGKGELCIAFEKIQLRDGQNRAMSYTPPEQLQVSITAEQNGEPQPPPSNGHTPPPDSDPGADKESSAEENDLVEEKLKLGCNRFWQITIFGKRIPSPEGAVRQSFRLKTAELEKPLYYARQKELRGIEVKLAGIALEAEDVVEFILEAAALASLAENGLALRLTAGFCSLELPAELIKTLNAVGNDLIVEAKRIACPEEAVLFRDAAGKAVPNSRIIGAPVSITTSFKGKTRVALLFPAQKLQEEGADFGGTLSIFVEHSDGESLFLPGEVQYDSAGGPAAISIWVDKFGSFVLLKAVRPNVISLSIGKQLAFVNGRQVKLEAAPFLNRQAGRTMVPVRFIAEMFGAEVKWIAETKQIIMLSQVHDESESKGGNDSVSAKEGENKAAKIEKREALLTVGSCNVLAFGREEVLDCPPEIVGGRAFVPVRFIGELLGAAVSWDGNAQNIIIKR